MSFMPCEQIWSILDDYLCHLPLMMSDCPLEICHKKGEYICRGVFVVKGEIFVVLELVELLDCI